MKWFVIAIAIAGVYLATMLASTSVLLNQTNQLQKMYSGIEQQANDIASNQATQH